MVRPPGAHDGAGVIVEEREQVRLRPADHRSVEGVAGPHLVRPGALEPAQGPVRYLSRGRGVQLEPLEQPLQGAVRRRPARGGAQDPADLRRGPLRLLPLQRLGQRQHLGRGPRRGLPRRRHQRVEPALLIGPPPPAQRLIRHRHRPPARPVVDTAGQRPGPPAPLGRRKPRLGELLHQRVPEQARRPGPLQPRLPVQLVRSCHDLSSLPARIRGRSDSDRTSRNVHRGVSALNGHARTNTSESPRTRAKQHRRRQERPHRHRRRQLPPRHREHPRPPAPGRGRRRGDRHHRIGQARCPAGSSGTGSGASACASRVKNSRTRPAEDRNRRSRSRTVHAGTPVAAAIDRNPCPRAARASMSPITITPSSQRRASSQHGRSTCVAPHEAHLDRRGRTPTSN